MNTQEESVAVPFERENRYIVLKIKDLERLNPVLLEELTGTLSAIANLTTMPRREFVVIESDWPEYEPVWKMLEERVNGERAALSQPPAPEQAGGEPRANARILHDFPVLQQFHTKHALGPMLPPSCLCCGQQTHPISRPVAVKHLELPGIVICKQCKDAATPTAEPAVEDVLQKVRKWAEGWASIHYEDPWKHAAEEILGLLSASPAAPVVAKPELPGMWEEADLSGGETDCEPEQQAQAGEPEVVAWFNTKWGFVEKDAEVRKALRNVDRIEESPAFLAGDLHALIKLQAYRNATSHLEAGYRFWFRIAKESGKAIAKKDAALQACVEALEACHSALVRIRESGGHSTSAEILAEKAIPQAQEAMK